MVQVAERSTSERDGVPPAVVVAGAAVTVALGGFTIWSGLDTLSARDDFRSHPTAAGYDDGVGREHRTNVLLGATAVAGVATAAIGIFGVRWTSSSRVSTGSRNPTSWRLVARPTGGVLVEGFF